MVPPSCEPGSVTPSASARTAPSDAPEDTPSVEPSASGLRSSPCIAAPHSESDAPVIATQSTRGRRTLSRILADTPSGIGLRSSAHSSTRSVSAGGMDTLPTQTHSSMAPSSAHSSSANEHRERCSDGAFIRFLPYPSESKGEVAARLPPAYGSGIPQRTRDHAAGASSSVSPLMNSYRSTAASLRRGPGRETALESAL